MDPRSSKAVTEEILLEREGEMIACRRWCARGASNNTHGRDYFGLALSGGGIRSATFNLGILQSLAAHKLLPCIDYLSTVSGGGYIGTWLHAVIRRYCGGQPAGAEALLSPKLHPKPGPPDEDPISFLRKYSSYLAPDMSLLGPDFWVIGVIWLRNMLLNQLILIPLLAGISLLALGIGFGTVRPSSTLGGLAVLLVSALAVIIAAGLAGKEVRGGSEETRCIEHPKYEGEPQGRGAKSALWCAGCALLSAFLLATNTAVFGWLPPWLLLSIFGGFGTLALFFLQLFGGFRECYKTRHKTQGWHWLVIFPIVAGAVTAGLLYGCLIWIAHWSGSWSLGWAEVAWGPPLIMLVWLAGAGLHIGLMGADFPDYGRESLARIGAFLSIAAAGWALLYTVGIFGPFWLSALIINYGKTAASAGVAWIAASAGGVFSAKSANTVGTKNSGSSSAKDTALEWIARLGPPVFMTGFLLLISFGVHMLIHSYAPNQGCNGCLASAAEDVSLELQVTHAQEKLNLNYQAHDNRLPDWLNWLPNVKDHYWVVLDPERNEQLFPTLAIFAGIAAVMVGLLPFRFNINEFSMQHLYKNRLVRCYLGASRGKSREPSRLTGFDACDDFPLAYLVPDPNAVKDCPGIHLDTFQPYHGPYPIISGTLNLKRGTELAKQEREGTGFIFTPLFCGFDSPESQEDEKAVAKGHVSRGGYIPTVGYGYPAGPDIGTAMGISGAAASPNHGYHTSTAVAFLLTIFDVRLGWWLGNPRRGAPSKNPGPRYSLFWLFSELFSQTDQRSAYYNISDGGHFENLGLYELVRRRCRYIIVGDGEQDQALTFESLGGAVRKCRADFGVEIDIDPSRIHNLKNGYSHVHCVVGRIAYPDAPAGTLLYLKASLTGDEPEDITQFHSVHDDFPHQTTANQFFTESQFESYRRLGQHVADTAFRSIVTDSQTADSIPNIFECLYQQWYPPSDASEGASSRHAEAYSALMKRLSDDPDLAYFDAQIIRQPQGAVAAAPRLPVGREAEIKRKAFFFCLDLIQLMENIWQDLRLYDKDERDSPRNAGWICIFQYWAGQDLFQSTWKQASYTFNPLFHQFFEWVGRQASSGLSHKDAPCGPLPD